MTIPFSKHFTAISLEGVANATREALPEELRTPEMAREVFGITAFRGIPFDLGKTDAPGLIFLDGESVAIDLGEREATFLVFLHVVEDRVTRYLENFADTSVNGNELGDLVSTYSLEYADGNIHEEKIQRRFAIQQGRLNWGASPFTAVPAARDRIYPSNSEDRRLGRVPEVDWGKGETRNNSARDAVRELLWLYALPNPHPDKLIRTLWLRPEKERSVIYGLSLTELEAHPLRCQPRRKLLLTLPEGAKLNAVDELEEIAIDLGEVISARRRLQYDHTPWTAEAPDFQPLPSPDEVVVEYAAHPKARIYVGIGKGEFQDYDLDDLPHVSGLAEIKPAHKPVRLRVIDKQTREPVGVRLHLHGEAGEYLPPRGYHRKVNPDWFQDNYAEFVNRYNQYCYIHGECEADLPLGRVFVEITRGYEVSPIRESILVTPETDLFIFELDRVLDWRTRGWVSADTHVHFLSPPTAQLEGDAEGVNVVNLLASQWGEMFSNVGDFDGKTTFGAVESGRKGEFLVRVGSENRMQVLGHISLLGYKGQLIHPLCTGGPSESAGGDFQEVTMAQWARQCLDQEGLVVMPHAPDPQCERAADIVLGLVNAMEMKTFNPYKAQISHYGLADWYRFLNLGYHLPVVGGSDKMSAKSLLGGVRTYTQLGEREFTYENWMRATREGNTFVTVGPLLELSVEGKAPGSRIELPSGGGTVNATWKVESVRVPISEVEVVQGGFVRDQKKMDNVLEARGSAEVKIERSTWIALRVRGSYQGNPNDVAAHSSAVEVRVGDEPLHSPRDAVEVLKQIEGAMAYVDTIAAQPDADRYRKLRATLESAYNRMHQRMHQKGVYHRHSPIHDHPEHHE